MQLFYTKSHCLTTAFAFFRYFCWFIMSNGAERKDIDRQEIEVPYRQIEQTCDFILPDNRVYDIITVLNKLFGNIHYLLL